MPAEPKDTSAPPSQEASGVNEKHESATAEMQDTKDSTDKAQPSEEASRKRSADEDDTDQAAKRTKQEEGGKEEKKDTAGQGTGLFGGGFGASKGFGFGSFKPAATGASSGGFGLGAMGGGASGGTNYFTQAAMKVATNPSGGFSGFGSLSKFSSVSGDKKEDGASSDTAVATETKKEAPAADSSAVAFPDNYEYETGTEGESMVAQCRAKLHHLDTSDRNWKSRGEGTLKLMETDVPDEHGSCKPRLVMWCTGSKRLLLNVRIWDGMCIERVNEKRLRFLAVETEDGQTQMNTYLVTTSATDAETMFQLISKRVTIHTNTNSKQAQGESTVAGVTFTKAESNLSEIARQSMAAKDDDE
eukprot:comp22371_c0_seq1/m.33342 comp22371_c0_seq1/g.33342  ORF comp22371_c0_seq1/g.33342 comp22371_c0_seq1/m.33342 type:complete len:359 (-) comp22371_c0_seq1:522-1598(-)